MDDEITPKWGKQHDRIQGRIKPSWARNLYDPKGHAAPQSDRANSDTVWAGFSKIHDRARRRKMNKRSWRKLVARERRLGMKAREAAIDEAIVTEMARQAGSP